MSGFTGKYLGFDFYFDLEFLFILFFASALGSVLRLILIYILNQNFLNNTNNTIIYALLPPVGYLITSIISSSIALSLGLVGALSIVRFRTPVKNPSELVYYFMLITLGIVLNVNRNYAVNFVIYVTCFSFILLIGLYILNKLDIVEKINFDNSLNYLNIELESPSEELLNDKNLVHVSKDEEKYHLILSSKDREYLLSVLNNIEKSNLKTFSLDFKTNEN